MSPESYSKVLSTAGKPRHSVYLYDNHDHINQDHVLFFVFHFELTLSPMASSQKFQLDPPFSTGKNIEYESVQQ